jgi:hypothetical protein
VIVATAKSDEEAARFACLQLPIPAVKRRFQTRKLEAELGGEEKFVEKITPLKLVKQFSPPPPLEDDRQ